MSDILSEFAQESEGVPDALETQDDPSVETADEYGYVEPTLDVPAPDESVLDQNPGFTEGAHA